MIVDLTGASCKSPLHSLRQARNRIRYPVPAGANRLLPPQPAIFPSVVRSRPRNKSFAGCSLDGRSVGSNRTTSRRRIWRDGRRFHGEDGEIRTDDFAVMTIDAIVRFLYGRRVITLGVEAVRQFQHISRAIGNTVATPFAAFLNNVHDPSRNQNFIHIQRHSPVFHKNHPQSLVVP